MVEKEVEKLLSDEEDAMEKKNEENALIPNWGLLLADLTHQMDVAIPLYIGGKYTRDKHKANGGYMKKTQPDYMR